MSSLTLSALADFPNQLEAHYAAIPVQFTHWSPATWEGVPSEPLTAIQQICHVRDIEIDGYHVRLRRTLDESHPTLAAIDAEALAEERSYHTDDGARVLAAFRAAREQTVTLIARLEPTQWDRAAIFEGYGPVSMRSLVHFLCSHDQQHLAGLQWLLGKIHASPLRAAAQGLGSPTP